MKILNKSLVSICFILLLGVLGAGGYALFLYTSAEKPITGNDYIKIKYNSLIYKNSRAHKVEGDSGDVGESKSDKLLSNASMNACLAENAFLKTVSTYSFKNINACSDGLKNKSVSKYDNRALNYLNELTSYVKSMAGDKNVKEVYRPSSPEEASSIIDNVNNNFESLFDNEITSNNLKNDNKVSVYNYKIKQSIVYAISALSVFLVFLFLTFFIIFIRIEKHISLISDCFVKKQNNI